MEPTAWGSGWQFALSGLDLGMTAVEAVEFAMKRDLNTGGEVIAYCWEDL